MSVAAGLCKASEGCFLLSSVFVNDYQRSIYFFNSPYTVFSSGRSSLKRFRVRLLRCGVSSTSITTDGPATTGAILGGVIAENEAFRLRGDDIILQ